MKKWYTSRWYKHIIYYKRLREREIDIMGIAIAIVCLFVLYRKWNKKITKEIEEQQAKVNKALEELHQWEYESEYVEMEMFLEDECCLGSLIADYYDVFEDALLYEVRKDLSKKPPMTKREYYESEMIKHDILDVYYQWKEEVLPTLLENED